MTRPQWPDPTPGFSCVRVERRRMIKPRLNTKQLFVLGCGLPFLAASIFSLLQLIERSIDTAEDSAVLLLCFPILLPLARLLYVVADPSDNRVLLTNAARGSLQQGACPFCGSMIPQTHSLKIGYRKPHTEIEYKFFWIEERRWYTEISTRLPICEECCAKFLTACRARILPRLSFSPSDVLA